MTIQAMGSAAQYIFQQEVTFKTDPSPAARRFYATSDSLTLSRPDETIDILTGNRNPTQPARGNTSIAGTLSSHLQAYGLSSMLRAAIGTARTQTTWAATTAYLLNALVRPTAENGFFYRATVAGTSAASAPTWPTTIGNTVVDGTITWRCEGTRAASTFNHLITVSELPSLLIEKGFTDISQFFKYNGCKVNRLSISCKPAGKQDVSIDFAGAKETASGTSFHAAAIDGGHKPFDGFSVASIREGGSTLGIVTDVSISVENNLDTGTYVIGGGGELYSLPDGKAKVSGTLTALFTSLALYNKAIAATKTSLEVVYQLGTGVGSAGNEYISISIPEMQLSPKSPAISGATGIKIDLPFEGFVDTSLGRSAIEIIVKNMETTI